MDRLKEIESIYLIRQFKKEQVAVSFSGGKDSLVALSLAIKAGIKNIVFSDTTIEPDIVKHYINSVSDFFGIEIKILEPLRNFWELLPILGPPSVYNRWCCPTLKYYQLNKYALENNILYFVTGLRKKESNIRKNYIKIGVNPMMPRTKEINPIIDWTEKEVWEYINKNSLPISDEYKIGLKRNGCIFCPYKSDKDLELMMSLEPQKWERFKEFLKEYALKNGIYNIEEFQNGGWKRFRPPQKKIKIEDLSIIDYQSIYLSKIINEYTPRLKKKILIEKSLNCLGCGACLISCPENALFINHLNKIDVDINKCKKCYNCTESTVIRKGCISRNYSNQIFEI